MTLLTIVWFTVPFCCSGLSKSLQPVLLVETGTKM